MLILAFDTTLGACSAAILQNNRVLAHQFEQKERGHSEDIMPMIIGLMNIARVNFNDLDAIAVTVGPGNFTGQRVSIALARGLRLALKKPTVGLTTLHVIAAGAVRRAGTKYDTVIINDANLGEVYIQSFTDLLVPKMEPMRVPLPEVAEMLPKDKVLIAGNASLLVKPFLNSLACPMLYLPNDDSSAIYPDAADLARLAGGILEQDGLAAYTEPPKPVYLRPPDAKIRLQNKKP